MQKIVQVKFLKSELKMVGSNEGLRYILRYDTIIAL